jgi:DNA-binding winged helix-turn-helix (wHTH) protein
MRSYNSNHEVHDRTESAFVGKNSRTAEPRPTYLRNSSARSAQHRSPVGRTRMPVTLRNATAEILADIDGLPVLFRIFVKDFPTQLQSDFGAKDGDIHTLLSSTLERVVDQMRGSSLRRGAPSKQPLATVELIRSGELPAPMPVPSNETVLRVGPLELDLLDRTARRGDRQIDLRPREFQLLKYMMQRSDKLLTRANLFKEVWHYKFVPETNLVDVHMGRLRRKVDGPNEAHMIRNVRGAGFVLSATPISEDPPAERSATLVTGDKSPRSVERILQ